MRGLSRVFRWWFLVPMAMVACAPTLTSFVVTPQVAPGKIFTVAVQGRQSFDAYGAFAGVVIQLPDGCVELGNSATGVNSGSEDPVLRAAFAAEPGHHLWAFSSDSPMGPNRAPYDGGVILYVQAPPTLGSLTVKVLLAGKPSATASWVASDPVGVTGFAQVGGTHAATVAVVENPSGSFELDHFLRMPAGVWTFDDVDRDGHCDLLLVASSSGFGRLMVWLWRPDGWVEQVVNPVVWAGFVTADLNRDGFLDVIDARGQSWLGTGSQVWLPGPFSPLGGLPSGRAGSIAVADVNHDGWPDAVLMLQQPMEVRAFLNNQGTSWTDISAGLGSLSQLGTSLVVGDLSGDGNVDVALGDHVWFGDGLGGWSSAPRLPTGTLGVAVTSGNLTDFDGNGVYELTDGYSGASYSWQGNAWQLRPSLGTGSSILLCDWDGDGMTDVFVYGVAGSSYSIWRSVGGMTFQVIPNMPCGLSVSSARRPPKASPFLLSDVDGDGVLDIPKGDVDLNGQVMLMLAHPIVAGIAPFGAGCAAPGLASPTLASIGAPQRGNSTFTLELGGGQTNGTGLVWIGTSARAWPGVAALPLDLTANGAPGCSLLTDPWYLAPVACDAAGIGRLGIAIPPDLELLRTSWFAQAAATQPGVNAMNLLFSRGLLVRLQ